MAIEPLGSMTAVQMQSTKVASVEPVKKQEVKDMDVNTPDSGTPKLDQTTGMVAKAFEKDASSNESRQDNSKANNEAIKKAVDNMNKNMSNTEAVFGIHDGTNRVTIKIIDKKTKEVVKELPPEKTLDMIEKVWEMAGILVDEKR